jgi:glucose/arabinose dehydrogenase
MDKPIMAFPGHWAPNDVLFYTGDMFPARYRNGAFIAFHGSWNRAPRPQAGYFVAFVPFNGDMPSGDYEIFAKGFTGTDTLRSPDAARYRPMGLAQGPDGSLYIADSQKGRIWRVIYNDNTTAINRKEETEKVAVAGK